MTVLRAYLHKVDKTGNLHVRVMQPMPLGNDFAADMHKCGSPAHWEFSRMEWDFPLTAACVLAIQRVAEKHHVQVYWSDDLRQFADEQRKIDDYEQGIRMSIENIMKRNEPLPGYVTNTFNGTKMPMRHQMIAYHWGLRFTGLMLAHDPGCLTGDTLVKTNRHSLVRPIRLDDLYAKFNNLPTKYPWKKQGPTTIKSLMPDGVLRHNEVKQVLYKGKQPTIKITLKGGKTISCTLDHEIATPGPNWVPAMKLEVGDTVLTNGVAVCPECGTSKRRIITYKYSKYRGICVGCAHRGKRNGHYKNGKYKDKDGYVYCSGYQNHPNANIHGEVFEHILVMEKHLGRYLTDGERVHHKDEIKDNNKPDNLELTTDSTHATTHGILSKYKHMDGGRAGTGGEIIFIPRHDTVVKIEWNGEQDVYDIVMADPGRNFVANGIIVHNCGKSRSAIDISRGWYDIGAVRPMQQVWYPAAQRWGVRGGILFITKSGVVRTVAQEYKQWQSMTALELSGERESRLKKAALPAHAHVINYESLKCVTHNQYDGLIIDESQNCANSSGFTENTLLLAQHARRRLALTGTPISNSLESAFYQMLIVDGGRALGPCKTKFIDEYFTSERQGPGAPKNFPKSGAVQAVSERMARCTYFLKKEDALDLPPKTHTPMYLEMATDQARYYNTLKDDYLVYIQDSQVSVTQAAARMMKLRQICQGFVLDDQDTPKNFSSAKVDALIEMLKGKLHGRKVVVWAVFTHEINMLCQRLMQEQIGFVRLDGTVKSKKVRDQGLELWNSHTGVSVFIGQIQMGVGITLHANECKVPCYDCVYLGIDYSFINWTQSQDRIHRIGQVYPCSYTYLLTADGVDRNIYSSLQAKANTSNAVYKAGKEFYASLVKGDEPNLAALDTAAA